MYFPRLKGLESYYCQNPNPITTNSTQHNLSLVREAVKKRQKQVSKRREESLAKIKYLRTL